MSDVDPAGQAAQTPVDAGQVDASPGNGQVSEPFYKYQDQSFDTPDKLTEFIRNGSMMRSDYTKKTQEHADKVKAWENERAAFYQQVSDFNDKRKGYSRFEEFEKILKTNPAAYRQMEQILRGTPQGQDLEEVFEHLMEEKGYAKKLTEFEEAQKKALAEKERDGHFDRLSKQYPDFNRDAVSELYDNLMAGTMGDFIDALHHAVKGKNVNPQQLEEKIVEGLEEKKKAKIPSSGVAPSPAKKASESLDEIAERQKRKLQGDDE